MAYTTYQSILSIIVVKGHNSYLFDGSSGYAMSRDIDHVVASARYKHIPLLVDYALIACIGIYICI